jgi:hypothetical protein
MFPDNTVLCNFATVHAIPLLGQILDGRGRWAEAIAHEAHLSSRYLPDLASLPSLGWLGDPIEVDDYVDIEAIELIRRSVFGGLANEPKKHLGEAQTCHIIRNREEFKGSYWVTDDQQALRYARFQGITTLDTMDLISEGCAYGILTRQSGFSLLRRMKDSGRSLRIPENPAHL